MSTIITIDPNNTKAQSINQLGTYNYTVSAANTSGSPAGAGPVTVSFSAQVEPLSGLTITIQQNGTTKASAAAPTAPALQVTTTGAGSGPITAPLFPEIGQSSTSLSVLLNCAQGDVISVILASALNNDARLNRIQGILNIRSGQV
jgi:hypothetical protein